MTHVAHAQAAIEAGLCEVAVIAYGSTQRSAGPQERGAARVQPLRDALSPVLPASAYALAASRHMHQYGTTREQLAEVAVAARQWALMNPKAWENEPLTIEQVLGSRMVSHPLTVRDCCLVTDGGGAIVMTSAARARSLRKTPAYVLGTGEAHQPPRRSATCPTSPSQRRANRAPRPIAMAGLEAADIDVRRALRRLHHHHPAVPRRPRLLPQGRRRPLRRRAAPSRPAAGCRSTRAAAACRTATPACTACSC